MPANPPAVAASGDSNASSAVAGAADAAAVEEWTKLHEAVTDTEEDQNDRPEPVDIMVAYQGGVCLATEPSPAAKPTPASEWPAANDIALPVSGGTAEAKETTNVTADSQLRADVGKAAGAPSAVAEKAPTAPAVEESAKEAILTQHLAAIDAPGARAKSTPPPLPKAGQTHMSEDSPPHHEVPMYVPVVLGEQSHVPAVADEPVRVPLVEVGDSPPVILHKYLKDLWEKQEKSETPRQEKRMINQAQNWHRDWTQTENPNNWANPPITGVDFTFTDRHFIGTIDKSKVRSQAGPLYDWCIVPGTDDYVQDTEFSIHKMLAHPRVRALLRDPDGTEWDVQSITFECLEPGISNDDGRHEALVMCGRYPPNGPRLPIWMWVIVRNDKKRYRFSCSKHGKRFHAREWPAGSKIDWSYQYSQIKIDGPQFCKRHISQTYEDPSEIEKGGERELRGGGGDEPGGDAGRGRGSGSLERVLVRAKIISEMKEMLQKRKARRPCPHDRHTISEPKAPHHLPPQAVQHDPPQPVRKQLPRDISPHPQPRKDPSHASAVADSTTATGNLTGACAAHGGWSGDWAADGGRFDDRGWIRMDRRWLRFWQQEYGIVPRERMVNNS